MIKITVESDSVGASEINPSGHIWTDRPADRAVMAALNAICALEYSPEDARILKAEVYREKPEEERFPQRIKCGMTLEIDHQLVLETNLSPAAIAEDFAEAVKNKFRKAIIDEVVRLRMEVHVRDTDPR